MITVSWNYDRAEIIADGIIHVIGIALAVAGTAVLLTVAFRTTRGADTAPVIIYVVGLLSMLGFSAAYNLWPVSPGKWVLRRFDHSAIFLLIAATYTAFIWQMKSGLLASTMLVVVWITAAAGIALKLFWPGRYERLSIGLYLVLGWSAVFACEPIIASLQPAALWLLVLGGALYSIGVLFHVWERLRFHTAIWHGFVLSAAFCHYMAVLLCVNLATVTPG